MTQITPEDIRVAQELIAAAEKSLFDVVQNHMRLPYKEDDLIASVISAMGTTIVKLICISHSDRDDAKKTWKGMHDIVTKGMDRCFDQMERIRREELAQL